MRRISNLAFNREFPAISGLSGTKDKSPVILARDPENPYDPDAVGVWLQGYPQAPLGWLFRKDENRPVVLEALGKGREIKGHITLRPGQGDRKARQKIIVFWL